MGIDYDTLDALEIHHHMVRTTCAGLSNVYVPGEGANPRVFVIGEAPGAQEEMQERPFVGPSGQVQRELMASAGLYAYPEPKGRDGKGRVRGWHEQNCWLTNVVKFRPARNRTPLWTEIKAFRPLLREEWQAVGSPRVIVPVGGTALRAVTGRQNISIIKYSGRVRKARSRVDGGLIYYWPMLHPAFGLRNEAIRPVMEKDWLALGRWLSNVDLP